MITEISLVEKITYTLSIVYKNTKSFFNSIITLNISLFANKYLFSYA